MCVVGGNAFCRQPYEFTRPDQQIDTVIAAAVTPLDQNVERAECKQFPGLDFHLPLVACRRRTSERGRLGQIGRQHQRARNEQLAQGFNGIGCEQRITRSRHHDRVEHDIFRTMPLKPLRHRFDDPNLREHTDLHRTNAEIREHGVQLRGNEIGGHVVNATDAPCILRGKGCNNRGPVDTKCGKGLEVSLDTGPAARVRTGYREGDRRHDCLRRSSALLTTASSSSAALPGSDASDKAEITATPSAPAAMTSSALRALMPAIAHTGYFRLRARIACTIARKPATPIGAAVLSFDVVPYTPPTAI